MLSQESKDRSSLRIHSFGSCSCLGLLGEDVFFLVGTSNHKFGTSSLTALTKTRAAHSLFVSLCVLQKQFLADNLSELLTLISTSRCHSTDKG